MIPADLMHLPPVSVLCASPKKVFCESVLHSCLCEAGWSLLGDDSEEELEEPCSLIVHDLDHSRLGTKGGRLLRESGSFDLS